MINGLQPITFVVRSIYQMMEKYFMTMTVEQKAARLEMIKAIAEKRARRAAFIKKLKTQNRLVQRWTEENEKPKRAAKAKAFDDDVAKMDENHNQWTDASSYAEKHYGERMRQTTWHDNEWD